LAVLVLASCTNEDGADEPADDTLNAVAPKAYEVIMNTAFEMFPDSAAAKGDRKALRGAGAQATNEQIAFAALMRGVHW
jgi:hypothetical protein